MMRKDVTVSILLAAMLLSIIAALGQYGKCKDLERQLSGAQGIIVDIQNTLRVYENELIQLYGDMEGQE